MKKEIIGVYGGTFSPPHLGHYYALRAFIAQERPDKTLVIPAGIPPHKQQAEGVTAAERVAMCRLAFADLPAEIDEREIWRGGVSYTSDTLLSLSSPSHRLLLLCGTDMFLSLESWHLPELIFKLSEIVYVLREGDGGENDPTRLAAESKANEYATHYGAIIRRVLCAPFADSSTDVRRMIAAGENTDALLSPDVRRYIDQCHLYRT